jgi:tetratricopeptide (TPR) repeat protein
MSDLGSALTTFGSYTNALDYHYKSLASFKKLKDTSGLSIVYGQLGLCYREQGDYKQAIQNFKEDIRLRKLMHKDVVIIGGISNN